MILTRVWQLSRSVLRFRRYKPQPITVKTMNNWLQQFGSTDQTYLLDFLSQVIYISEEQTRELLVKRNGALLQKLAKAGIPLNKIIYVQFDDAGSSSAVMLNLLKESARLERQQCHFLDSKDIKGLHELTKELGEGAVVYVDDFVGTGNQFCRSRDFAAQYFVGTFAEFLLVPCICEEALYKLGERGVEAIPGMVHSTSDRPLHAYSSSLDSTRKERLIELCRSIDKKGGLGYKDMATMVVFYRNAPNTLPVILRGSVRQDPFVGVLPRTTDLPTI
jgi:hypothetical protein